MKKEKPKVHYYRLELTEEVRDMCGAFEQVGEERPLRSTRIDSFEALNHDEVCEELVRMMLEMNETIVGATEIKTGVTYLCDRMKCKEKYGGECPGDSCRHTFDIRHAKNFVTFAMNDEIVAATEIGAGDEYEFDHALKTWNFL